MSVTMRAKRARTSAGSAASSPATASFKSVTVQAIPGFIPNLQYQRKASSRLGQRCAAYPNRPALGQPVGKGLDQRTLEARGSARGSKAGPPGGLALAADPSNGAHSR